jgi:hypothetical protein
LRGNLKFLGCFQKLIISAFLFERFIKILVILRNGVYSLAQSHEQLPIQHPSQTLWPSDWPRDVLRRSIPPVAFLPRPEAIVHIPDQQQVRRLHGSALRPVAPVLLTPDHSRVFVPVT